MKSITVVTIPLATCYLMIVPTAIVSSQTETSFKFAADRTINHVLHAVPTPGAVSIDGRLDEWDTSGGILSCKNVNLLLDLEEAPGEQEQTAAIRNRESS